MHIFVDASASYFSLLFFDTCIVLELWDGELISAAGKRSSLSNFRLLMTPFCFAGNLSGMLRT